MNGIALFKGKTSKLGMNASEGNGGTPVPHAEPSIFSVRPDTGPQTASAERTDERESVTLLERAQPPAKQGTLLGVIPVYARHHQHHPRVITFAIPVLAIKEKCGVTMKEEKFYLIRGSVGGKYDFEMYRTIDRYVRHSVPVECQHLIRERKVYDIGITCVEELPLTEAQRSLVLDWRRRTVPWNTIAYRVFHMEPEQPAHPIQPVRDSLTDARKPRTLKKLERVDRIGVIFVLASHIHRGGWGKAKDRFYFLIQNSEYRRKTGMVIEEGATYKIRGEIRGVGLFEKKLRCAAAMQDVPIFVPYELKHKVELGKEYEIAIDSIERIPSVRDSWERRDNPSLPWTWKEIASWIDTEGRISGYADIAQKDKKVIEEICTFYENHGLHPNMLLQKEVGCYHASLHKIDDVATVVKNIEPYIRTENKKEQIAQFKERLKAPRKRLYSAIINARRILGLG